MGKKVTLLVGNGNNGGDAFAAGLYLLGKGFEVHAAPVAGKRSPLNKIFRDRFLKKGGQFSSQIEGLVIDGLLGTGFKGQASGEVKDLIQAANHSGLPIIAIDIPSGLNGNSGEVKTIAIKAKMTIALGLPKMGFFLRDGWNHVGVLRVVDFGLPKEAMAKAKAVAYLPNAPQLPKMVRNRHKYQAGYVVGYGGSQNLSGAAKLTGSAALKAGAGIVRLFTPEEIGAAPLDLIVNRWNLREWKKALQKAAAVFVGPGLGRFQETARWLKSHLKEIELPCVIDADAILPKLTYPEGAVLTPHRGEVLRLLNLEAAPKEEELFAKIARFCNRKKVIVLLKGGPTFVFAPQSKPIIITRGDPGMAKAGSGDVLTGMIAALLAQGVSPREAAVLGAVLHGIAGEEAAKTRTSYCLIAEDLIEFMPAAFAQVLKNQGRGTRETNR